MLQRILYTIYVFIFIYLVWFIPAALQDTAVVNLVPFHTIRLFWTALLHDYAPLHIIFANLAGNVLITIPIGMLLLRYFGKIRFTSFFLLAIAIPVLIEFGQLLLHVAGYATRTIDIDDVLLNTIGIGIGYYSMRIWNSIQNKLR